MARGVDVRPVVGHPFFLITLVMAIAGWFTAFVGQVVLESKFHAAGGHGSAVGVPWFGIFLQMFLIVGVFSALASDTVALHRFQLSLFLAIAVVFSVLGVNSGIFNSTAFQLAIGAGWMLLAVVNILWLLFFSSEEGTFLLSIFNSGSHSSFTRRSRTGPSSRAGSIQGGNMSVVGSGAGSAYQNPYTGVGKAGGPAGMSVGELAHDDGTRRSPTIGSNTGESNTEYLLKAKALYSYSASPDDPNEISFTKGDILDIVDNSGKWWQARKADGTKGIIPSNYVVLT